MRLTPEQRIALQHVCYLPAEMGRPRFGHPAAGGTLIVTVGAGYEEIKEAFGGPIWHVSASARSALLGAAYLIARDGLVGMGDAKLGEWVDEGDRGVCHIRRRLTAAERKFSAGLVFGELILRDIRGTDEEKQRLAVAYAECPGLKEFLDKTLGASTGGA